jgi:hypothetical protein
VNRHPKGGRQSSSSRTLRQIWLAILLLAFPAWEHCFAGVPALESIFPIAFARGTKETVAIGGKLAPWPVGVWTDCSGITFTASTNTGKLSVEVSTNAPPGPHLLRIYNSDGASEPRIFLIRNKADVAEKEPNDSVQQAQTIDQLPVTIGGRLEKSGDVDTFGLHLEAGKWFVAKVDAYSLGSPVDAALHLLDGNGVRVGFCHDDGPRLDPILAFEVKKTGTYFLEIAGFVNPPAADIRYAGSPATLYELALTQGPFIKDLFPAGVQTGTTAKLQPLGWNLEGIPPLTLKTKSATNEHLYVDIISPESRVPIVLSDETEIVETEPNNTSTNAQEVTLPCIINGRIAPHDDQDRFQFSASKGEKIALRLESAQLGFSLEPVLSIEDRTGHQLAPEDRGNNESKMSWTAPTNGLYIVAVSDLFHRGGDDYGYRLAVGSTLPDFRAIVTQDSIRLTSGTTNDFKIDLTRLNNYTNRLKIVPENLPTGVTVKIPEIPQKNGEITLALVASSNAPATNQMIRFIVQPAGEPAAGAHSAAYEIRSKEAAGNRMINETDRLWLTVIPQPLTNSTNVAKKK